MYHTRLWAAREIAKDNIIFTGNDSTKYIFFPSFLGNLQAGIVNIQTPQAQYLYPSNPKNGNKLNECNIINNVNFSSLFKQTSNNNYAGY